MAQEKLHPCRPASRFQLPNGSLNITGNLEFVHLPIHVGEYPYLGVFCGEVRLTAGTIFYFLRQVVAFVPDLQTRIAKFHWVQA